MVTSLRGGRVIDTHVHLWRYASPWMAWLVDRPPGWDVVRRDFTWTDLQHELDEAQVSDVILMQACTTPAETRMLLEVADAQPRVQGVVGWVTLQSASATKEQLDSFSGKLVGVRNNHLWAPDGDIIARDQCLDSVRLVEERGLCLDLHFPDYTTLPLALRLAERFPRLRIVIDHLGKPDLLREDAFEPWVETMRLLSQLPNLAIKYSGWATFTGRTYASDVQRYIERTIELFGSERVMFASNWPVALVAGTYGKTFEASLQALAYLGDSDLDNIMYQTALRWYVKT